MLTSNARLTKFLIAVSQKRGAHRFDSGKDQILAYRHLQINKQWLIHMLFINATIVEGS
jgi:hypothetical protein